MITWCRAVNREVSCNFKFPVICPLLFAQPPDTTTMPEAGDDSSGHDDHGK
jgi:hypothetical protein